MRAPTVDRVVSRDRGVYVLRNHSRARSFLLVVNDVLVVVFHNVVAYLFHVSLRLAELRAKVLHAPVDLFEFRPLVGTRGGGLGPKR